MYKTVYHRCKARRQAADAYTVLASGAAQQFASGQLTCGAELLGLLVDAYVTDGMEPASQALSSVLDVMRALPTAARPLLAAGSVDEPPAELEDVSRAVMAAIKWAHKGGADSAVEQLHDAFAEWTLSAYGWRQFGKAALHFSRGADAAGYAAALAGVVAQADPREAPLFVARAVLQTLACAHARSADRQLRHAEQLLVACGAALPELASTPLAHFCELLLQALQLRRHALLGLLRERYATSLAWDPALSAYLSTVEQVYFNVRPQGGSGRLLGGLLRGLLEGDEDEHDDD